MADQYRDNEWQPEDNEGKRQSSARTGNTSRFAYTDKHMPNGNYHEDPEPARTGGAGYGSPSARGAQGYPTYASGSGQGTPQKRPQQRQNAGQPAQGAPQAYNGGQPAQGGGQRTYYSNGQPVQGGQRAYYGSGQPAQGNPRAYYSNGQPVQGGQRVYYSNGQPVQQGGQRAYSGQPVQGGQRAYNGQPAQGNSQRPYYGNGQPAQGGQRVNPQNARPSQNAGGQRTYAQSGQPMQGGQRQPVQNAGGQKSSAGRAAARPENGHVAQGQVRRSMPAGSRAASGEPPVKRENISGGAGGAGNPPGNNGGRSRASASGAGRKPGEKKKRSTGMIVLMVVLLVLLGGLVFAVAFVFGKLGLMGRDLDVHAIRDVDDVYIDEHVKKDTTQANYTNILLVGIDSRDASVIDHANSDTMIICSINNTTGKVRLVSIYRDTYLNIMSPENVNKYQYNKANAAYNLGSAPQLLSMINANLDLSIKDYAVVDFRAVIKLVDAVDGIDITLTDQEAIHLNNYQVETAEITGLKPQPVDVYVGEEPRVYHLNGIQATAYCRIRYTNGWDMKRTQRQRLVIEKIIEKVKAGGLGLANRVLDDVLPLCYTSMNTGEIFSMATKMFSFDIEKTTGFPEIHLGKDISNEIMSAQIPVTLEDNVIELHKWLFDMDSYETSQTVKDFSRQIILNTGYGPERRAEAIADSEIGNSGGEADLVK